MLFLLLTASCLIAIGCSGMTGKKSEDSLDWKRKTNDIEKMVSWKNQEAVPDHLALAKDLMERAYYQVARVQLESALKDRPGNAEIYHLMGVCLRETRDLAGALKSFQQALAYDAGFAPAYNGMGTTYYRQGRMDMAAQCFQKAMDIDPARGDFCNNLGYLEMRSGRLKNAETHFRQGLDLNPKNQQTINNLALCLALAGRDKEAQDLLERSFPPSMACNNLGAIYQTKGEPKKALQMFQKALELDPALVHARRNLDQVKAESTGR